MKIIYQRDIWPSYLFILETCSWKSWSIGIRREYAQFEISLIFISVCFVKRLKLRAAYLMYYALAGVENISMCTHIRNVVNVGES